MLIVEFESAAGVLRFGTGHFRLTEAAGLGPPQKEFTVTSYAGEPGQETISEKDLARVITLSGDVRGPLRQELARMMRVLYLPGELRIASDDKRRRIACRCTAVEEPVRQGGDMARFVVQFTADRPYFTDYAQQRVSVYQQENFLQTTFTLPCALSTRTSRGIVVNAGDVAAEPVLTIACEEAETVLAEEETGIEVINHTTGQSLFLLYQPEPGETVVINVPERTITSSKDGNLLDKLSRDSYLSQFWLGTGPNDVEAVRHGLVGDVSMECTFDNQYIEAVY